MSSTTKIKRGAAPVRKPRPRVKTRKVVTKKGPSWFARMLVTLRITPAMIHRATMVLIFAALLALIGTAAYYAGIPRRIGRIAAEEIGRAGFVVRNIEIDGLDHMNRDTVYGIVTDANTMSMASVDLSGIRQKLLNYGWVADAQVSRRLPDTLVVSITERKPAAVWQQNEQLSLVDANGMVLEPVTAENMPKDIPLVIGPDANRQAAALVALLSAAPRLKPLIAGASWVGNRRWDLRFQTGETLQLPEGNDAAARALTAFADTDASHPLLGKGYARFDARSGTQLMIKLSTPSAAPTSPSSTAGGDDAPHATPATTSSANG